MNGTERTLTPLPPTAIPGGGRDPSPPTPRQRVELPPPDPLPPRARFTFVGAVTHQSPDGVPTTAEIRAAAWLETDEQPWVRHTRVGADWVPLDTGYVKDARLVVVTNKGVAFRVNPTPEQQAAADGAILSVGVVAPDGTVYPFAVIPPGESMPFQVHAEARIVLRAPSGPVPVTIHAIPR